MAPRSPRGIFSGVPSAPELPGPLMTPAPSSEPDPHLPTEEDVDRILALEEADRDEIPGLYGLN